jgi:hypothetical protein
MMIALDSPEVKQAFGSLERSLGNLGESLGKLFGVTSGPDANGFIQFFTVLAQILDGIVQTVDVMVQSFKNAFPIFNTYSNLVSGIANALVGIKGTSLPSIAPPSTSAPNTGGGRKGAPVSQNVTINVNKGNVTAEEIVEKIRKARQSNGSIGTFL